MKEHPLTKEQAQATRYNVWAGNPKGNLWSKDKCAYTVWSGGQGSLPYQCNTKPGHGPDELYCKLHASLVSQDTGDVWYRTWFNNSIEEIFVTKSTDKMVWIKSKSGYISKTAILSRDAWNHFRTRQEAKDFLLKREQNRIASAKAKIEACEKNILEIEQL